MEKKQQRVIEKGVTVSPEFFRTKEISRYLGITASTIYSLVGEKKIPHYKVGRLVRFKRSEIDQWMEKKQVACAAPAEVAKKALKPRKGTHTDIDRIVNKSIEKVLENQYNYPYGKSDQAKGLGKEVHDGSV